VRLSILGDDFDNNGEKIELLFHFLSKNRYPVEWLCLRFLPCYYNRVETKEMYLRRLKGFLASLEQIGNLPYLNRLEFTSVEDQNFGEPIAKSICTAQLESAYMSTSTIHILTFRYLFTRGDAQILHSSCR
jgi:hypothetical protein